MRQIISLVFAGVLGGLIVLSGMYFFNGKILSDSEAPAYVRMTNDVAATTESIPDFDFTFAAERAMDAVVHIKAKESDAKAQQRRQQQPRRSPFSFFFDDETFFGSPFGEPRRREGSGSGVILTKDGYIVTNNHVVEFADIVEVTLHDNRKFEAEIVGRDPQTDVAVLKIQSNDLHAIPLGDSDNLKVGEWVLAVGNPFNLTSTVTAGIVSAKGRSIGVNRTANAIEGFIQTDAAVNPGNSGGALVDKDGKLVGINTAIASPTGNFAGYSFAIPINIAIKIVDDLIEFGSYQRAYLGIGINDMDSELASELGVNITTGVAVIEVYDGGSAQYAGLLPNDIITSVNGRAIRNIPELQDLVGRSKVGETITVTVNRKGKVKEIPVTLRSSS
jgi:serine protease Do